MRLFNRQGREPSVISRADRAREAGQWQLAAGLYRTALDRKPRNPLIWVQYGHALKECGSRTEAEDAYRTAIVYAPEDADAHLHLGHVLKLQGKTAEAQAAYQRALAINGSLAEAARELNLLDRSEQRLRDEPPQAGIAMPARGEPLTVAAVHRPATRPKSRRGKGSFISRADRARDERQWELAADLYRMALDRNPNNSPIWVQYGHALKEAGHLPEAESAYRVAIAHNAAAAEPYLQLGHVLKMRGRHGEAQMAYLQALALQPSMTEPLHGLNSLGWPERRTAQLTAMLARDLPDPKLGRPQPGRRAVDDAASGDVAGVPSVLAPERSQAEAPVDTVGNTPVLPPSHRQFRVLYVSGTPDVTSHDYRVVNYVEALRLQGIDAEWIPVADCDKVIDRLGEFSLVVFCRVRYAAALHPFISTAEQLRIPTVFDIDDYVFEPKITTERFVDAIRFVPSDEIDAYHQGVLAYRAMILATQFATFPTKFLVDRGEELKRPSFLLPNGLDRHYLNARPRQWKETTARVIIGYTPGTRTHQKDICVAAAAITRVLAENANAVLRVVGHLEIDEIEEWRNCRAQIEHDPTVGRDHVRQKTSEFDINIAPVELNNPFTAAKSELKYFEAACLGVPTVASATAVFCDAIRHGDTGFVARSEDDWYTALTALARDPSLRHRIGAAAREHVLPTYGLAPLALRARQVYGEIIGSYRRGIGRGAERLTVTMVMAEPTRGSGGHGKAISLIRGLSQRGHDVALHFTPTLGEFSGPDAIRQGFGIDDNVVITWGEQRLRPCDVVIATFWKTAHIIAEQSGCGYAKLYFIQDYEPLFYPISDDHFMALRSYQLGLQNIAYGPWVRDRIERELGVGSKVIPFFIDKSVFYGDPAANRATGRLIVFARPEMPRRLWNLTVTAIELFVAESGFSGTVEFFGSRAKVDVPFPCVRHDVLTPQEMASLFREGTLGVAISSTNPSMVPFEMMACGLPVVDIDHDRKELSYGDRGNAFLAAPTPEALADAIGRAMAAEPARRSVSENAFEFIRRMPEAFEAVEQLEQLIFGYLGDDKDARGAQTAEALS
jgi:tetratricopeptide (TPR) repeat protein/glycosyltransferase involved in cell wall biosynthesis